MTELEDDTMSRSDSSEQAPPNAAPKVFISYSHDSEEHKDWVRAFATDLRKVGINAVLDEWDLALGQEIARFIEKSMSSSDTVIFICTRRFVNRANQGFGGVAYEGSMAAAELIRKTDTTKFVPIVRDNDAQDKLPRFLDGRRYVDFSQDADYTSAFAKLILHIHGISGVVKPPLGSNPFAGLQPTANEVGRIVVPSGSAQPKGPIVADSWFSKHQEVAQSGIDGLGLKGSLELRFALRDPTDKPHVVLRSAVEKSQIRTSGWPIGIVSNRGECRPRPTADGIVSEIKIDGIDNFGQRRLSYDYWTLRTNGDFYLVRNLSEDARTDRQLFFDTRILRVTESLMFCQNLYTHLNIASDSLLRVRVTHRGLTDRQLGSASPTRFIETVKTHEDMSLVERTTSIEDISKNLTDLVAQILEPMFMLFDFTRFDRHVYDEIVQAFVSGKLI